MPETKLNPRTTLMVLLSVAIFATGYFVHYWHTRPLEYYTATHFGIETIKSNVDFNGNGVDDYTDILVGAQKDAANKPHYDGAFQPGGYPPDNIGVCTDVIWRAFKQAGYSLKDMVDRDIAQNTKAYPRVAGRPEPDIDFRRVPNMKVFFERHAISLTLDVSKVAEWQPGDIVTYGTAHIGIVSDRRNADGIPFLIHNSGQPNREEDALTAHEKPISGHFRFDASRSQESNLVVYAGD